MVQARYRETHTDIMIRKSTNKLLSSLKVHPRESNDEAIRRIIKFKKEYTEPRL